MAHYGSGVKSYYILGKEDTFGTESTAITKFFPNSSSSKIDSNKEFLENDFMNTSVTQSAFTKARNMIKGSFSSAIWIKLFEDFFPYVFGDFSTVTDKGLTYFSFESSTISNNHYFSCFQKLGDQLREFTGGSFTNLNLSVESTGLATFSSDVYFSTEVGSPSLVAIDGVVKTNLESYLTQPVSISNFNVYKWDTHTSLSYGDEVKIKTCEFSIDFKADMDNYYLGSANGDEPRRSGVVDATLSFSTDADTDMYKKAQDGDKQGFVLVFNQGTKVFRIYLPVCQGTGESDLGQDKTYLQNTLNYRVVDSTEINVKTLLDGGESDSAKVINPTIFLIAEDTGDGTISQIKA